MALAGPNGVGKSSLFALLTGKLTEDSGSVSFPPGWRIAQVEQHVPDTDAAVTDYVLQGDAPLMQARQALAAAEQTGDGDGIAHAHMLMHDAGAYDAQARAQQLLMGLGFTVAQLRAGVNTLSGGWRMRLQLARALAAPSDLLLLDEPTNHLDMDALVWLERWLQSYQGTLLVISHDRDFLDAVVDTTLHMHQVGLRSYRGNYSAFERQYAQQMVLQQAAYEKQQEKVAHLRKFIDRFKAKATKAKQAQSRVKALERMEKVAPVLTAASFQFAFETPAAMPNPMLSMQEVTLGYRSGQQILHNVSCSVLPGQRIGVLGANGQGKSTLVKAIAGVLPVQSGKVVQGRQLRVGYFAQQEMDVLQPDDTPLLAMQRLVRRLEQQGGSQRPDMKSTRNASEQALRSFLGGFRFSDDTVHQPVESMSGGERARLVMATIVWQSPNLLLLDEPTNHLDLVTREALALALNDFDGTVMLVSHDRAMLRATCDSYWLVSDGGVSPFDGDLQDYQRYLAEQEKRRQRQAAAADAGSEPATDTAAETGGGQPVPADGVVGVTGTAGVADAAAAGRKMDRKARAAQRERLRPLRSRQQAADRQLAQLRQEEEGLHQALAEQKIPGAEMAEVQKRLAAITAETEQLEEQWLELEEAIEQALQQDD